MPLLALLIGGFSVTHAEEPATPRRAAAELGLVEHQPVVLPDWAKAATSFWVKTTSGACAEFRGRERLEHELCRLKRDDGARVTDTVALELLRDPRPPPPADGTQRRDYGVGWGVPEGGPLLEFDASVARAIEWDHGFSGGVTGWRTGPWYAVSSDADAVQFQTMVKASFGYYWEGRPCIAESLAALRSELAAAVQAGRRICAVEGRPLTERVRDFDGIICSYPHTEENPDPVDCRLPCPPRLSEDSPTLHRDPDPETVALFRTNTACVASTAPGLFPMPTPNCAGEWPQ